MGRRETGSRPRRNPRSECEESEAEVSDPPLIYYGYIALLVGVLFMALGVFIVGCEKGWWLK
jgi:hypothetical protein